MALGQFACFNSSQDTATPWRWVVIPPLRTATVTMSAFLILFMLIGIPWNLLLIVIIVKKRLFKQPAILLLLNLAVTNLLLCLLIMPMVISPAIAGEFIFGESDYIRCQVCHLTTIIMSTLLLMSVYNVVLLSLDRFLYVKKPLNYNSIVTVKRVVAILTLCWVLFIAFSILPVFGVGFIAFAHVLSMCAIGFFSVGPNNYYIYYWINIISASIIPTTIFLFINAWILCIMRKSISSGYLRAKRNSRGRYGVTTNDSQAKRKHAMDNIRLIQIFGALFLSSIFTWMPLAITVIMITAGNFFSLEFTVFATLSFFSQPVVHATIQLFLLKDVRAVIVKPFKFLVQYRHKRSETPSISENNNEGDSKADCSRWNGCSKCCGMLDRCGWALVDYNIESTTSQESQFSLTSRTLEQQA